MLGLPDWLYPVLSVALLYVTYGRARIFLRERKTAHATMFLLAGAFGVPIGIAGVLGSLGYSDTVQLWVSMPSWPLALAAIITGFLWVSKQSPMDREIGKRIFRMMLFYTAIGIGVLLIVGLGLLLGVIE